MHLQKTEDAVNAAALGAAPSSHSSSTLCIRIKIGHIFTDRLLNLRGEKLTMLMGSSTIKSIVNKLDEDTEFINRERLSQLSYVGHKKISRINRKTAIIAFSTEEVYAIAELVRRQKGGAAIVMGSLSPKTRNAQVQLYQSGDVDFLVATDAIGMGINMDLENVFFSNLKKFDGRKLRRLNMSEIGQIAGRAGRYLNDGNFGITGDCKEISAADRDLWRLGRRRSPSHDIDCEYRVDLRGACSPPFAVSRYWGTGRRRSSTVL